MKYEELRRKLEDLGADVDRSVFFRRADGGWQDRVQGVEFNIVDSHGVRIFTSGDRGTFFQRPGDKTVFPSVSEACDWIWREICYDVAPQLLSEAELQQVRDEAQATIEGRL